MPSLTIKEKLEPWRCYLCFAKLTRNDKSAHLRGHGIKKGYQIVGNSWNASGKQPGWIKESGVAKKRLGL